MHSLFDRNGRFAQTVSGSLDSVVLPTIEAWDGFHCVGEYDGTYYFTDDEVIKRPENSTELDGLTLHKVPSGSTIIIDSEAYECADGGNVELNFTQPGAYKVTVVLWPYLDKEFEIDYHP